jgi:multidrug resistance efflux pump
MEDNQGNDLAIREAQPISSPKISPRPSPLLGLRRNQMTVSASEPTARLGHPQTPPSDASTSARVSPAKPKHGAQSGLPRLGKRLAAIALLLVGGAALMTNANYITSDNAVVTAHVVSLRSPIEGLVATNVAAVGDPVSAGTLLAGVTNSLADDRQVVATRARLARLRADLDAAVQEQVTLTAMLDNLTERAAHHRAAKLEQLALDMARIGRDRGAKQDQLEQMVRDMRRKVALRGTVSESDIEAAETEVRVAAQQVASLDRQIDASNAAAQAAEAGVLAEANSANDVAYSEQRADEVRERLADLTRTISEMRAAAAEAEDQLLGETAMLQWTRAASISVPSPGMIWRVGAASGERVAPGDLLAQIVDCGAAVLAVAVPQNRLSDIDMNAIVTFRLAGERQDRIGHIAAITGESAVRGDAALATVPVAGATPVASVLVAMPASPNQLGGCLVGRTARVLLPASGGGWADWATRQMPLWLTVASKK